VWMRHGEVNALKDQADGERIRTPPLNSGESGVRVWAWRGGAR
jgi:hypothetical protein